MWEFSLFFLLLYLSDYNLKKKNGIVKDNFVLEKINFQPLSWQHGPDRVLWKIGDLSVTFNKKLGPKGHFQKKGLKTT